jgi:radical SAM superfamily enzyme YgiQ (UPF0313 family)
MSKVVLVEPYWKKIIQGEFPPLGMCRIATFLQQNGHEVDIVFDNGVDVDLLEKCKGAKVVGVVAIWSQLKRARHVGEYLQSHGFKTVIGGAHVSATSAMVMPGFNHVVKGPGEHPMLALANGEELPQTIIVEPSLGDTYIPLSFDAMHKDRITVWECIDRPAIGIQSSDGCPFDCKFCCSPKTCKRKLTLYPIEDVVKNIFDLSAKHVFKAFRLWDDVFTADQERLRKFCSLVKGSGLYFSCLSRVNFVRPEDLPIMREAGFQAIAIGIESGNEKIRAMANKKFTNEEARKACRAITDSGMLLETLWVYALPGETPETAKESIALAVELGGKPFIQPFQPYPGTTYFDEIMAGQHGDILQDGYDAPYNLNQPIFLPKGMTKAEYMTGWEVWNKMYARSPWVFPNKPFSAGRVAQRNDNRCVTGGIFVRNRLTGTCPAIIHANGCKASPLWLNLLDIVRRGGRTTGRIPKDLTVLTWNTKPEMSALELSLQNMNAIDRVFVLGCGLEKWDRHQISLTLGYLDKVTTPYIMGCDAFDAVVIQNPEQILDIFLHCFGTSRLVYAAETNFWPDWYNASVKQAEDDTAKRAGAVRWKYLNSGNFIGETEYIKWFYQQAWDQIGKENGAANDEQGLVKLAWMGGRDNEVSLDYNCQMFQCLFGMSGEELDIVYPRSVQNIVVA